MSNVTIHRDNLIKMSLEELEELYERENNLFKNKKLIGHLPDKGKQLQEKIERVLKEIQLRKDMKEIENNMTSLTIEYPTSKIEILKEKHVQHICSIEKSPNKERYKPFATLVNKNKIEKPTQLITLAESISLLADQATKLPIETIKRVIEGTDIKVTETCYSDVEEEEQREQHPESDSDDSEKT